MTSAIVCGSIAAVATGRRTASKSTSGLLDRSGRAPGEAAGAEWRHPHLLTSPGRLLNALGGVYDVQTNSVESSYVDLPIAR